MHKVRSEITGSVWKVEVAVGQAVVEGDTLVIVESMKMEIPISAPAGRTIVRALPAGGRVPVGARRLARTRSGGQVGRGVGAPGSVQGVDARGPGPGARCTRRRPDPAR